MPAHQVFPQVTRFQEPQPHFHNHEQYKVDTDFEASRSNRIPNRSETTISLPFQQTWDCRAHPRLQNSSDSLREYVMFVSVEALLSVAHSGVRHVPWAEWGPAGTRILLFRNGIPPIPAGPVWITSYAPLVVHDYSSLRARYVEKKRKSMSSVPTEPSRGPCSTKLFGEHRKDGEIETRISFRRIVADDIFFKRVVQVVADREWIVVIARTVRCSILLYS